jgi:hypothetical protein
VHPDHVFKEGDVVATDRDNARMRLRMARGYNLLALKSSAGIEGNGAEYLRLSGSEIKTILSFMMPLDT